MAHVSIRMTDERKAKLQEAADRLGLTLTDLLLSVADVAAERVVSEAWECRQLHLLGDRIVGIGEDMPSGMLPIVSFPVLAQGSFWKVAGKRRS